MELEQISEIYANTHEALFKQLPRELREQLLILEDCFNALRDMLEAEETGK